MPNKGQPCSGGPPDRRPVGVKKPRIESITFRTWTAAPKPDGSCCAHEKVDLRVLLITESTYPFHYGGVSTWCRNLIIGLPAVDFEILALVANPDLKPIFELPANVSGLTTVPIWEFATRSRRTSRSGWPTCEAGQAPTRSGDARQRPRAAPWRAVKALFSASR